MVSLESTSVASSEFGDNGDNASDIESLNEETP